MVHFVRMTNISFFFFLNTHYFVLAVADIHSATLPLAQGGWDTVTATLDPAGERATENLCMGGKLSKAASLQDPWPASNLKLFLFLSNGKRNFTTYQTKGT